jgi:MFS family permease
MQEQMLRSLAVSSSVPVPDRIFQLGNGSSCALRCIWELFFTVCCSSTQPDLPTKYARGLDTTVAADVQAQVYEDLGHIENLQWIGLGFPMASAAVILTYTRGYGLFNVKVLILSSFSIFEIGSAICGAAPTSNALIVGRVAAGVGGAGM